VLPEPPDLVAHRIGGTRLEFQRDGRLAILPGRERAKSHPARARERDANDAAVVRLVPVPADGRPRSIFGHQCVEERGGRDAEPCAGPMAKRVEVGRQRRALDPAAFIFIVDPSEANNAPFRRVLLKKRLLERQRRQGFEQGIFLGGVEEIGTIQQAMWQALVVEQSRLIGVKRGQVQFCHCRRVVNDGAKIEPDPISQIKNGLVTQPVHFLAPSSVRILGQETAISALLRREEKTVNPCSIRWLGLPAFRPCMLNILPRGRNGLHRCFADSNVGLRKSWNGLQAMCQVTGQVAVLFPSVFT
jgi:hypothetical protein